MADPNFDGKCGIPSLFTAWDGTRFRCLHPMAHTGNHSWEKYRKQFQIFGGITVDECIRRAATTDSPAAQAIVDAERRRIKD